MKIWSRYSEKSNEQKKEVTVAAMSKVAKSRWIYWKDTGSLILTQRLVCLSTATCPLIILSWAKIRISNGHLLVDPLIAHGLANLISILDLGWAEMVPLQFAATYPRFLTHEPRQHGSFDWVATNTDRMQKDRLAFRECIRDRAVREGGVCQDYYDILSGEDGVNLYWWFIAISEADKHMAMESCGWSPEPSFS